MFPRHCCSGFLSLSWVEKCSANIPMVYGSVITWTVYISMASLLPALFQWNISDSFSNGSLTTALSSTHRNAPLEHPVTSRLRSRLLRNPPSLDQSASQPHTDTFALILVSLTSTIVLFLGVPNFNTYSVLS